MRLSPPTPEQCVLMLRANPRTETGIRGRADVLWSLVVLWRVHGILKPR